MKSDPSSFRDPSGVVFLKGKTVYRQVNQVYSGIYDLCVRQGLFDELVRRSWLIPFDEISSPIFDKATCYKVLRPQQIPFVSYPYEWCFSQLKDAALLTLNIQKVALKQNFWLKDASTYNVQFLDGGPIFIDTLSFEPYPEGEPWVAYKQFCQHFLAPLALMSHRDARLNKLMQLYVDGIPLELVSCLLPKSTYLRLGLGLHIHAHAKSQRCYAGDATVLSTKKKKITKTMLFGIIDSLESTINGLKWAPKGTEWGDYYQQTNYEEESFKKKRELVAGLIERVSPKTLWDMGGNTGIFSRIASQKNIFTVSFDIDEAAVEQNYRQVRSAKETHLLPLIHDLTNPVPNLGWGNAERLSIQQRGHPDAILALALIHHLAISNNVPLQKCAEHFSRLAPALIMEFVPKSDSQVKRLLQSRKDIFPSYHLDGFKQAFEMFYETHKEIPIPGTERILFLFKRK